MLRMMFRRISHERHNTEGTPFLVLLLLRVVSILSLVLILVLIGGWDTFFLHNPRNFIPSSPSYPPHSNAISYIPTGRTPTIITEYDRIYNSIQNKHHGPFVNTEYRWIFFSVEKVACTEWKRMLMRMNHNSLWCDDKEISIHNRYHNNLTTLSDFPMDIATQMMTSSEWTKAIFVREPKERILSAFLDKVIENPTFWRDHCCRHLKQYNHSLFLMEQCRRVSTLQPVSLGFLSFLRTIRKYPNECWNNHWDIQAHRLDTKWWPYIQFIGYHNRMQYDAKELLGQLYPYPMGHSQRNENPNESSHPLSAWDRYGTLGWGGIDCATSLSSQEPFVGHPRTDHQTDAKNHLKEYYSQEAEKLVEELWAEEWKSSYIHFDTFHLFS